MAESMSRRVAGGAPLRDGVQLDAGVSGAGSALGIEDRVDLVVGGVALAGLSLLAAHLWPGIPRMTLGLVLGVAAWCLVAVAIGRRGGWCRVLTRVVLVGLSGWLVWQVTWLWRAGAMVESRGRMALTLLAVLVVLCLGLLWTLGRSKPSNSS